MSHNLALINSLKVRLGLDCMYSISSSRPAESCVVVLFQLISRRACPISPPPGNCLPRPAASPAAGTGRSWTPPQSDYFCPGNINTHLLFLSHFQIYLANVLRSPQPKIFFLEKNIFQNQNILLLSSFSVKCFIHITHLRKIFPNKNDMIWLCAEQRYLFCLETCFILIWW